MSIKHRLEFVLTTSKIYYTINRSSVENEGINLITPQVSGSLSACNSDSFSLLQWLGCSYVDAEQHQQFGDICCKYHPTSHSLKWEPPFLGPGIPVSILKVSNTNQPYIYITSFLYLYNYTTIYVHLYLYWHLHTFTYI